MGRQQCCGPMRPIGGGRVPGGSGSYGEKLIVQCLGAEKQFAVSGTGCHIKGSRKAAPALRARFLRSYVPLRPIRAKACSPAPYPDSRRKLSPPTNSNSPLGQIVYICPPPGECGDLFSGPPGFFGINFSDPEIFFSARLTDYISPWAGNNAVAP